MIDDFIIYAWQQKVYVVAIKAVLFFCSALGVSHCLKKRVQVSKFRLWAHVMLLICTSYGLFQESYRTVLPVLCSALIWLLVHQFLFEKLLRVFRTEMLRILARD